MTAQPPQGPPTGPQWGPIPPQHQPDGPLRKRKRWPWIAGGSVALLIIIIGLSNSGGSEKSATDSTTTTASSKTDAAPAQPTQTAQQLQSSSPIPTSPTQSRPAPAAAPTQPIEVVTGFGATATAWDSHHSPNAAFAPGTAYNADPSLSQINGHTGSTYVLVSLNHGRVLSYVMNLHPSSQSAAIAIAAREFPGDVRVTSVVKKDTCVQVGFSSATLGHELSDPSIGDPAGNALVEFEDSGIDGTSATSPTSFNSASFSLSESPTPDPLIPC